MTTQEHIGRAQITTDPHQGGTNIINIAIAVGEGKWTVFWVVFACIIFGLGISLSMTNIYTARTTFLPPQQNQSAAASALSSLGGFAGLAGGAFGIKSPDEMYVAFLQSEGLQNNVIERLKLQNLYNQKTLSDTRKVLSSNIKITPDKIAGLIKIEADDPSPIMAAQLANAHVEALRTLLDRLAVTEAQQRRVFFENLITKTKNELALAELQSEKAQETSGIVSLDAQTASAIRAAAELRAQITLHEVQIRAMSSYATPQNSDMQRLSAELTSLRNQLEKLEQGSGKSHSTRKSEDALANLRAFREVKYQQAVLDNLTKQYELARVQEAKEGPLIQQLDVATPPEKKSKPKRAIIVIISAMCGLILSLIIVIVRYELRRVALDPSLAQKLGEIQRAWRFRNTKI